MRAHIRHQLFRLHRVLLGDLALLLGRACTNDMWVRLEVVRLLLLCIACCRIRLSRAPCSTPLPRRKGAACSRFVVRCVACRARVCWVCFRYVIYQRNSRQSDDALPIGLPQSDYLAHLVDYVYDSPRRFAHRLSCCRFWARRSNSVPRDESPASCERCTTMRLASCKGFTFYQIAKVGKWLSLPMSLRTMPIDSWHLPP